LLSAVDRERVRAGFRVYEHEWRYFSGFLGEPFLVDGCLIYWDGSVISFPAFSLAEHRRFNVRDVAGMMSQVPSVADVQVAFVWGDVELADKLDVVACPAPLTAVSVDTDAYPGEFTIDILDFDLARLKEARKAVRMLSRKDLSVRHRQLDGFEHHHFRLVEEWVRTRSIGSIATCATTTLPAYCREPHVHVFEVFRHDRLVAFAVVSLPTSDRAIVMWSFSQQGPGARLEDSMMYAIIEYCRSQRISTLECGYAGNASLARFKRKWGARQTAPDYRLGVFTTNGVWAERGLSGRFYWAIRMGDIAARNDRSDAEPGVSADDESLHGG